MPRKCFDDDSDFDILDSIWDDYGDPQLLGIAYCDPDFLFQDEPESADKEDSPGELSEPLVPPLVSREDRILGEGSLGRLSCSGTPQDLQSLHPVPIQAAPSILPSQCEVAQAKTRRSREALDMWYVRFRELIEYKKANGDCNVPQKCKTNPKLGIWVNKQRREKGSFDKGRASSMTERKVRNLEDLGFTWANPKGEGKWEIRYNELRSFHQLHGHCDVPTKCHENRPLGRWVSTQRSEYKQFQKDQSRYMTADRVKSLNSIGFRWEMMACAPESNRDSS